MFTQLRYERSETPKCKVETYGLARKNSLIGICQRLNARSYEIRKKNKTVFLTSEKETIGLEMNHINELGIDIDNFYEPDFESKPKSTKYEEEQPVSSSAKYQNCETISSSSNSSESEEEQLGSSSTKYHDWDTTSSNSNSNSSESSDSWHSSRTLKEWDLKHVPYNNPKLNRLQKLMNDENFQLISCRELRNIINASKPSLPNRLNKVVKRNKLTRSRKKINSEQILMENNRPKSKTKFNRKIIYVKIDDVLKLEETNASLEEEIRVVKINTSEQEEKNVNSTDEMEAIKLKYKRSLKKLSKLRPDCLYTIVEEEDEEKKNIELIKEMKEENEIIDKVIEDNITELEKKNIEINEENIFKIKENEKNKQTVENDYQKEVDDKILTENIGMKKEEERTLIDPRPMLIEENTIIKEAEELEGNSNEIINKVVEENAEEHEGNIKLREGKPRMKKTNLYKDVQKSIALYEEKALKLKKRIESKEKKEENIKKQPEPIENISPRSEESVETLEDENFSEFLPEIEALTPPNTPRNRYESPIESLAKTIHRVEDDLIIALLFHLERTLKIPKLNYCFKATKTITRNYNTLNYDGLIRQLEHLKMIKAKKMEENNANVSDEDDESNSTYNQIADEVEMKCLSELIIVLELAVLRSNVETLIDCPIIPCNEQYVLELIEYLKNSIQAGTFDKTEICHYNVVYHLVAFIIQAEEHLSHRDLIKLLNIINKDWMQKDFMPKGLMLIEKVTNLLCSLNTTPSTQSIPQPRIEPIYHRIVILPIKTPSPKYVHILPNHAMGEVVRTELFQSSHRLSTPYESKFDIFREILPWFYGLILAPIIVFVLFNTFELTTVFDTLLDHLMKWSDLKISLSKFIIYLNNIFKHFNLN